MEECCKIIWLSSSSSSKRWKINTEKRDSKDSECEWEREADMMQGTCGWYVHAHIAQYEIYHTAIIFNACKFSQHKIAFWCVFACQRPLNRISIKQNVQSALQTAHTFWNSIKTLDQLSK